MPGYFYSVKFIKYVKQFTCSFFRIIFFNKTKIIVAIQSIAYLSKKLRWKTKDTKENIYNQPFTAHCFQLFLCGLKGFLLNIN